MFILTPWAYDDDSDSLFFLSKNSPGIPDGGTIFSLLYYPATVAPQNPMTLPAWGAGFLDTGGNGMFTYRNAYQDRNDMLGQIYPGNPDGNFLVVLTVAKAGQQYPRITATGGGVQQQLQIGGVKVSIEDTGVTMSQ